ncbi:MAG: hypothetical protein AB7J40_00830 [Candidatus Altimarinota bacterium]
MKSLFHLHSEVWSWQPKRLLYLQYKYVDEEANVLNSDQVGLLKKQNLIKNFQEQKERFESLKSKHRDLKEEVLTLQKRRDDINKEIQELTSKKGIQETKLSFLIDEKKVVQEKLDEIATKAREFQDLIKSLETEISHLDSTLSQLTREVESEQQKTPDLEKQKEEVEKSLEKTKSFKRVWKSIAGIRASRFDLLGIDPEQFAKVAEIGTIQQRRNADRIATEEQRIAQLSREIDKNLAEIERISVELESVLQDKNRTSNLKATHENELNTLKLSKQAQEAVSERLDDTMRQVRDDIELIQESQQALEIELAENAGIIEKKKRLTSRVESKIENAKDKLEKMISRVETLLELREKNVVQIDSRIVQEFFEALQEMMETFIPSLDEICTAIPQLQKYAEPIASIKKYVPDSHAQNLTAEIERYLRNNVPTVVGQMVDSLQALPDDEDIQGLIAWLGSVSTAMKKTDEIGKKLMREIKENANQEIKKLTPKQMEAYRGHIEAAKNLIQE